MQFTWISGNIGNRWHKIPESDRAFGNTTRCNPAFPTHYKRHPDTTFIKRPLSAPEGCIALKKMNWLRHIGIGPVVTGKNNDRIFQKSHLQQPLPYFSYIPVHPADHCCIIFGSLRPGFVCVRFVGRNIIHFRTLFRIVGEVRNSIRHIKEKRV